MFAFHATYFSDRIKLAVGESRNIILPSSYLTKGTNVFVVDVDGRIRDISFQDWDVKKGYLYDEVELQNVFNANVENIFNEQYLSPRPEGPTLQLPTQGIGNWCYPLTTANVDASGLIDKSKNSPVKYLDIPFQFGDKSRNVLFSSQWDNFPTKIKIPLSGKAQKLYLIMAGSTNPMQSQLENAKVKIQYQDGTEAVLSLRNPINWWPIEQDFYDNDLAFELPDDSIPFRVALKTGELYKGGKLGKYSSIKGFTDRAIDGGAATLLDIPLDYSKMLESAELVTESNDVVVGIMAMTLLR